MPKKKTRYTAEEVERALHMLALEAGNAAAVHRKLGIPEGTLKEWRSDTHRERYERIRVALEERLARDLAEEMVELGRQRVGILRRMGDEVNAALDAGDTEAVHRLAGADRNFATSAGILTQNSRMLQDKPTHVIEQRYDVAAIDEGLRKLGLIVDSTAVEVEPPALDAAEPAEAGST